MDVLWFAPLVALAAALGALVLAGRAVRRAAANLAADVPSMTALGAEVPALHGDLALVRDRLDRHRAAASTRTGDQ